MKPVEDNSISLQAVQQAFQAAMLQPKHKPPAFLAATSGASSAQRFNVYSEAYHLRLLEALTEDYPALQDYLGAADFASLVRKYVQARPSNQFSIRWFGRHLPDYLMITPAYKDQPFLKELATFEWALSESFDAPDSTSIDFEQLASIEPGLWPVLKLRFHPAMRRIKLRFNAPQVWQASNQQQTLPETKANTEAQAWVTWRQDLTLLFRSMTLQESIALDAFMAGKGFAEVCEQLSECLDEQQVAVNAAAFLQNWVRAGWVVAVQVVD